jgi:phosphatidate cytidylyltransferase
MKQRTITSAIILAVMLIVVLFSKYIIYPIVIALLAISAIHEIQKVIGINKRYVISAPACIGAAIFPTVAYFVKVETAKDFLLILFASLFLYLLWLMAISIFSKGNISFKTISEVFASAAYVIVSFTALSLLRYLDRDCGVYAVVLVFIVAWVCDVFAYAVGMLIGKHKLIPEISPKKTIEGSIGGIVFCVIAMVLYGWILEHFGIFEVRYPVILLYGLLGSLGGVMGDLTMSVIKRQVGIKDYGNLIPGHGGILDRFDSVMITAILTETLLLVIPFMV